MPERGPSSDAAHFQRAFDQACRRTRIATLAGLWEAWYGEGKSDGPPLESCSLITTDANKLAAKVHDRMPVILDPADYDTWLDPDNQDTDELQRLLEPYSSKQMSAKPVSTFVNNARNQGPECVEPRNA